VGVSEFELSDNEMKGKQIFIEDYIDTRNKVEAVFSKSIIKKISAEKLEKVKDYIEKKNVKDLEYDKYPPLYNFLS
jgi:hypothetical protein